MRNTILRHGALCVLFCGVGPAAAQDKVTYDDHIKEIFRGACFKCHNPDKAKGDLVLTTYSSAMLGGASGLMAEPGDVDGSLLYAVMTHAEEPFMPPKSPPQPKAELDLVKRWIEDGLLENKDSKARIPAKPKLDLALSDAPSGRPEGPPPMPQDLLLEPVTHSGRTTAITAMHASPWAPVVAVGGQRQIVLYHTDTLSLLGIIPFAEGVPYDLRFSRNGKLLLAGGGVDADLGTTVLWDVATGDRLLRAGEDFDAILCADLSGDQKHIATGGPDKYLNVYLTATGERVHHLKKHTDWVTATRFSPDGVLVASGDRNGNLFVWESGSGILFYDLRGHKGAITSVSWRPDSNVLASGSEDGTIKLWNMHDGKQLKSWSAHGGGVLDMNYTMDGRIVSAGRDKVAKLWDANGAQQRAFPAQPDLATAIAVSHDSKRVFCADWDGHVRVYNSEDAKQVGDIDVNPPRIDEQIAAIQARLAEVKKPWETSLEAARSAAAAAEQKAGEMPAAEQAVAAARQREADMEQQRLAAEAAMKQAQADMAAAQQRKTDTEQQHAAAKAALEQAQADMAAAQQRKAQTDQQAQAAAAARDAVRKALKNTQDTLAQLQALESDPVVAESLEVAQGAIKGFSAKAQQAEGRVAETAQAAQAAGDDMNQKAVAVQAATDDMGQKATAAQAAAADMNQKAEAAAKAQTALADAAKQVEAARSQVTAAETARAAKAKEVEAARAAAEAASQKAEASKPAELPRLEDDLRRYQAAKVNIDVRAARDRMKEQEAQFIAIQQELEAAKAKLEAEKQTFEAKQAEYRKLLGGQ